MVDIVERRRTRFMVRVVDKKTGKSRNCGIAENGLTLEKLFSMVKTCLKEKNGGDKK